MSIRKSIESSAYVPPSPESTGSGQFSLVPLGEQDLGVQKIKDEKQNSGQSRRSFLYGATAFGVMTPKIIRGADYENNGKNEYGLNELPPDIKPYKSDIIDTLNVANDRAIKYGLGLRVRQDQIIYVADIEQFIIDNNLNPDDQARIRRAAAFTSTSSNLANRIYITRRIKSIQNPVQKILIAGDLLHEMWHLNNPDSSIHTPAYALQARHIYDSTPKNASPFSSGAVLARKLTAYQKKYEALSGGEPNSQRAEMQR